MQRDHFKPFSLINGFIHARTMANHSFNPHKIETFHTTAPSIPKEYFLVHQHGRPFNVLHTNMAARIVICKRSLGSTVKRNCKFNCVFNFAGNASQEVHILCLRKWFIFLRSYFQPLLSIIRTKRPDLKQLRLLW